LCVFFLFHERNFTSSLQELPKFYKNFKEKAITHTTLFLDKFSSEVCKKKKKKRKEVKFLFLYFLLSGT